MSRKALGAFGALALLAAAVAIGVNANRPPPIEYTDVPEYEAIARQAFQILRQTCPKITEAEPAAQRIQIGLSMVYSFMSIPKPLGWKFMVAVDYTYTGHDLMTPGDLHDFPNTGAANFLMGAGKRPGILLPGAQARLLCDRPAADQLAFIPVPGLALLSPIDQFTP